MINFIVDEQLSFRSRFDRTIKTYFIIQLIANLYSPGCIYEIGLINGIPHSTKGLEVVDHMILNKKTSTAIDDSFQKPTACVRRKAWQCIDDFFNT